ncbi:MAG TPA: PTS sugar transporter subunit IIC [Gemmatimonadales bacterium]|nr:PTS sugar transporter subunit IIC [Gemmatimonadales bacterium]
MSLELALLAWGTFVGLDLVTVPQVMIARPIVAGPLAGLILGDVWTGLAVGMLFELFQYDVLPVGAARYPEYGPATVAAVTAAHAAAGPLGIGLGAVVGLVTALAGGISIHVVRRLNARAMHAASDRLEAGDTRALMRLHAAGIGRDAARAALVTGLGLALARLARDIVAVPLTVRGATWLSVAAVGAALAAAAAGTLRVVGRGPSLRWFAAGLVGGAALAWLR